MGVVHGNKMGETFKVDMSENIEVRKEYGEETEDVSGDDGSGDVNKTNETADVEGDESKEFEKTFR